MYILSIIFKNNSLHSKLLTNCCVKPCSGIVSGIVVAVAVVVVSGVVSPS